MRNNLGPTGIALMDIDDFKICNDTYGHHAGDLALETVAKAIRPNIRVTALYLLMGVLLLLAVTLFSGRESMRVTEEYFARTISFVKVQSTSFEKYNDTITAKALRRMAVAVRQLAENDALDLYDPESLQAETESLWLTGIAVLDADGKLLCEYTDSNTGYVQFAESLQENAARNVLQNPQKTYLKRILLADGTAVDVATRRAAAGDAVLLAALILYLIFVAVLQTLRHRSMKLAEQQKREQQQKYHAQLEEQNRKLELAVRHEAAANRAKREFLFNMSHDIRTPMNAIIGFTSLAATHIDNKEQVLDYLKKISISSQHLLSLINDVLDMSRIESGKVKIEEKAVHLPDLVHEESSTVSGIQGTGLGLSITKNIVDLMGGTITLESEPGKGSEFIVNLCFPLSGQKAEIKQLPHHHPDRLRLGGYRGGGARRRCDRLLRKAAVPLGAAQGAGRALPGAAGADADRKSVV